MEKLTFPSDGLIYSTDVVKMFQNGHQSLWEKTRYEHNLTHAIFNDLLMYYLIEDLTLAFWDPRFIYSNNKFNKLTMEVTKQPIVTRLDQKQNDRLCQSSDFCSPTCTGTHHRLLKFWNMSWIAFGSTDMWLVI